MSEREYAPEPLTFIEDKDLRDRPRLNLHCYEDATGLVAVCEKGIGDSDRGTFRRLAAAYNACKGIPTEDLENPGFLERARLYARPLKDLETAKRLLRELALEMGGVGLHNSSVDVLGFLGVSHYQDLLEPEPINYG